jgi:hypothetical protein
MRNYRAGRATSNRPEVYRTRTERNVVQQQRAIMAMPELAGGEHITIQQVASRIDANKSIASSRLVALVNDGKLEKTGSTHMDHRWKKRMRLINPLSILWTAKALKGAYSA